MEDLTLSWHKNCLKDNSRSKITSGCQAIFKNKRWCSKTELDLIFARLIQQVKKF
ncbi:Uncharacterized protein dnm_061310 [Desulfonema magnum]|uniref:Uncharacterized protein n=1 Tax=Desulfonema magnum TaxID=45655 RepID=A0A975BS55_9BACT|nr:Uncharacterized protein dnm_061310 [Desulfonema magnum]